MPRGMSPKLLRAAAAILALVGAAPAHAYMGPALGLGAIAASLGVIGTLILGFLSVLWYPVKRLIRRLRRLGRKGEEEMP